MHCFGSRSQPNVLSSLERPFILYLTLVRSKLECVSIVWNSITSTDATQLEIIQKNFAVLCSNRFFPYVSYIPVYTLALEQLHNLRKMYRLDAVLLIQAYLDTKLCLSLCFANCWAPSSCSVYQVFFMFNIYFNSKNCTLLDSL
jgi:hypothetical protein